MTDPTSYEDMAGQLLSEIADLIFSGTQDWQTLERLQAALHPTPTFTNGRVIGIENEPPLKTISAEYIADAMSKIYESKIRDQTKPMSIAYHHTPKPQTTGTYNGSQWVHVKDYGAKYDPGSRPGKT